MSDIIKKNNDYLRIKYTDGHGLAGIKPFQRDILLFEDYFVEYFPAKYSSDYSNNWQADCLTIDVHGYFIVEKSQYFYRG